MKIIESYQQAIASGEIFADARQLALVPALDEIAEKINEAVSTHWLKRLTQKNSRLPAGIYLWGSVGSGKTWLMSQFYHSLKTPQKWHLHFHEFMSQVQRHLNQNRQKKDPLKALVNQYAKQYRVIFLDEFLVNDIADAMILYQLLQYLFEKNIFLITTANTRPDKLYEGGIQRSSFLPAIDLIQNQMWVRELSLKQDFRSRVNLLPRFIFPETPETIQQFKWFFDRDPARKNEGGTIKIHDRWIHFKSKSNQTIWFDFNTLCNIPRSQEDYLELAKQFSTIYISGLRHILQTETHIAVCFIQLIDILYAQKTEVMISSYAPLDQLYLYGRVKAAFKRTQSRLQEMCAKD